MLGLLLKYANEPVEFEAVCFADIIHAYAMAREFNGLFYINVETGDAKFIGVVDGENIWGERLYFGAVKCNDKIYFSPNLANKICVYNISDKNLYTLDIPAIDGVNNSCKRKFGEAFVYNDYIYMLGADYPGIVKIDPESDLISIIAFEKDKQLFFRRGLIHEGCLIAPSNNSGVLLNYDLHKEILTFFEIDGLSGSWNICYNGDYFYMISRFKDEGLFWWDGLKQYGMIDIENRDIDHNYIYSYANGKSVIVTPEKSNDFIILGCNNNLETKKIFEKKLKTGGHSLYFESESELFYSEKGTNELGEDIINYFAINKLNFSLRQCDFSISNLEDFCRVLMNYSKENNNGYMYEKEHTGLNDFCDLVKIFK